MKLVSALMLATVLLFQSGDQTNTTTFVFAPPADNHTIEFPYTGTVLMKFSGFKDGKWLQVNKDGTVEGTLPHKEAAEAFWKAMAQAYPSTVSPDLSKVRLRCDVYMDDGSNVAVVPRTMILFIYGKDGYAAIDDGRTRHEYQLRKGSYCTVTP